MGSQKRKKLNISEEQIDLSFGSGGQRTAQLFEELFLPAFENEWLLQRNDNAQLSFNGRLVISTDAHVVSPLFFPGGDIGKLAVCGTINDVCVSGATPLSLTASFILEEGFPLSSLQQIANSMGQTAKECGVAIVAGDTKVVERGKGDGVFISTTGIGILTQEEIQIFPDRASPGDKILMNGTMGDHGMAILSLRENLDFQTTLKSDVASLHDIIKQMVQAVPEIHCLRDATRGGVAAVLNELAQSSQVGIIIEESKIPIRSEVEAACEFLGLDPLNVANEGKLVAICPANKAKKLLTVMQSHSLGKQAAIIGEVVEDSNQFVRMKTSIGGTRMVHWPGGEELPRIC